MTRTTTAPVDGTRRSFLMATGLATAATLTAASLAGQAHASEEAPVDEGERGRHR